MTVGQLSGRGMIELLQYMGPRPKHGPKLEGERGEMGERPSSRVKMAKSELGIPMAATLTLRKDKSRKTPKSLLTLALCYDFDGTLAPGNMQEHSFLPAVQARPRSFWNEVRELSKEHNADNILIYMGLMLDKARTKKVPVRKTDVRHLDHLCHFSLALRIGSTG